MHHSLLKLVKHPNLHVCLVTPIKVGDANSKRDPLLDDGWWERTYTWSLYDVEAFVDRIAVSTIKTVI